MNFDNLLMCRDMKPKTKYQVKWIKTKQADGWQFVSWILPPDVKMPLVNYKKYLMSNRGKTQCNGSPCESIDGNR